MERHKLDSIDLRILSELQDDGRHFDEEAEKYPRFLGLTGSATEIAAAKNDFKVFAQKMPCPGFLGFNPSSRYYESFYEKLTYYFENFILFRMVNAEA